MLKIDFLLNQRALWFRRIEPELSRAAYAAPVEVKCRVEERCGAEASSGKIFLPGGHPFAPGDKFSLEGRDYLLKSIEFMRGFSGEISHAEGELI